MAGFLDRRVALPADHGSWAFLLSPLVIGLFAGGAWPVTTSYLVVAALCAFLVRQPITRLIRAWSGRSDGSDVRAAVAWMVAYATVGLLHVIGLVLRGAGHVLWLAVPGVPVFSWYLWLVWHRAERRQVLVEIAGAGVLALTAPAALWIARGEGVPEGWLLFVLTWGHTACLIVLAHLRLEQRGWPTVPPVTQRLRAARAPLTLVGLELVLVGVAAAGAVVPWLLLAPYGLQLGLVVAGSLAPGLGWPPRRIGLHLVLATTLFTALFVVTWSTVP